MSTSRRPRRLWSGLAFGLVLLVLGGLVLLRAPAPVSHWNSTGARTTFFAAYDQAAAAMPRPERTLDVRTDFGVVRVYRFAGPHRPGRDGPPLVLLPGTRSASPIWADNLPGLLRHADVYAVDLLGEPGHSIQDRPIEDADDQAGWLDQTLAGLPEDRFHVVGLSIGGWTAMNLALRRPAHVAAVTLIDPVQVFDDIPVETVIRSLPASLPWLPRSWRDGFNSYTAGGAPVEDVPAADMIEAGMHGFTVRVPMPVRIREQELSGVRPPVLVVLAGRSVMHDPPTALATARRSLPPTARVLLYEDASHAVNGEYPDRLAADIAAFPAG